MASLWPIVLLFALISTSFSTGAANDDDDDQEELMIVAAERVFEQEEQNSQFIQKRVGKQYEANQRSTPQEMVSGRDKVIISLMETFKN